MKSWTVPGPHVSHAYWLKKLNVLHECLAAELNQLLIDDAPRMTNRCLHSTDPEGGHCNPTTGQKPALAQQGSDRIEQRSTSSATWMTSSSMPGVTETLIH